MNKYAGHSRTTARAGVVGLRVLGRQIRHRRIVLNVLLHIGRLTNSAAQNPATYGRSSFSFHRNYILKLDVLLVLSRRNFMVCVWRHLKVGMSKDLGHNTFVINSYRVFLAILAPSTNICNFCKAVLSFIITSPQSGAA